MGGEERKTREDLPKRRRTPSNTTEAVRTAGKYTGSRISTSTRRREHEAAKAVRASTPTGDIATRETLPAWPERDEARLI